MALPRRPAVRGPANLNDTTRSLRRFRVAVEDGAGQDAAACATTIERIFEDPRGWAVSGQLRWQRVPRETSAEFTVFLATPGTSERVCATGGLRTERYTNCRLPAPVMQQQTLGLRGCTAYGWPYLDGRRYAGPSVP